MKNVCEHISHLKEKYNISNKTLAKFANTSQSTITNVLQRQHELCFASFLNLARSFNTNEKFDLLNLYTFDVDRQFKNVKPALEYALINKLSSAQRLNDRLKDSTAFHDKEISEYYQILIDRHNGNITPRDVIQRIEERFPTNIETAALANIIKLFAYFEMKEWHVFSEYIKPTTEYIQQLNDGFMKHSYTTRLSLSLCNYYLYKNNVENCRESGKMVLESDISEYFNSVVQSIIGRSYLFESSEKAVKYLNLAKKYYLSKKLKRHEMIVDNNIRFINSFWHLDGNYTIEEISNWDIYAYIFYCIKFGYSKEAKKRLSEIPISAIRGTDIAFYYYYKGLALNEIEFFYRSCTEFKRFGDHFYLNLPIIELTKSGKENYEIDAIVI